MVRELKVEDPNEGKLSWEQETEQLHDLVYLGIELSDELTEQRREKLGWVPAERDPRGVRAEASWNAYHVWLEGKPELADLPPGTRLSLYAASLTPKQED